MIVDDTYRRGAAGPEVRVVKSSGQYRGKQGFDYHVGLTSETAGTRAICLTVVTIPPGARANTHLHRGIETAVYVIEGEAEMLWGDQLERPVSARAGEYIYVPADVTHSVMNNSSTTCVAVVAHSAANDQEGIVLRPELDGAT